MAENTVVKEQLTDAMVDAGAELTRKLDELGLQVNAALWYFMPDVNEWRLLFASPEVSAKGPRSVYAKIGAAIQQLGAKAAATPLSAIGVLDDEDEIVKVLRALVRTGPALNRMRVTKNAVNGHFIDDALIYRIA